MKVIRGARGGRAERREPQRGAQRRLVGLKAVPRVVVREPDEFCGPWHRTKALQLREEALGPQQRFRRRADEREPEVALERPLERREDGRGQRARQQQNRRTDTQPQRDQKSQRDMLQQSAEFQPQRQPHGFEIE